MDETRHHHYVARCGSCGKRSFNSRRDARRACRATPDRDLRPYRCPLDGGYWHNGRLAPVVKAGDKTRAQAYTRGAS